MSSVRRPEHSATEGVELGRVIRDPNQSKAQPIFEVKARFEVGEESRRSLADRETTWLSVAAALLGGPTHSGLIQTRLH